MSQSEILKLLNKKDNYITINDITQNLKLSRSSIQNSLRVLSKNKEIKKIYIKDGRYWRFKYKINERFRT